MCTAAILKIGGMITESGKSRYSYKNLTVVKALRNKSEGRWFDSR